MTNSQLCAALSLVLASACGGVENPDAEVPVDDTTAPVVASTVPAAGATGVSSTDKIHITFSEPIDRATLEAAYTSADLPAGAVSMSWNEDGTVLTISPDAGLVYAEGIGTDPSVVLAKVYSLAIGTGTADLSGNTLEAPLALSFATKRRMAANVALDGDRTRVFIGGVELNAGTNIAVGDNASKFQFRSYLSFDLSPLPQGIEIEAAELSVRQMPATGVPYTMGAVMATHVAFGEIAGINAMEVVSLPGALSMDAQAESKKLDVTSQIADDIQNRVTRDNSSQYRLQIDTATNNDDIADKATFAYDTLSMSVVYIAD